MKPLRILHLEDDPADARIIADVLRVAGLDAEITVIGDRPAFVAAVERGGFHLALADYKLPGFDGLQALALWRAWWPDKPFLFVTGFLGEERAVESLKSGATDYVLKDALARLVPAIHRAVIEAREHERRQQAEEALRLSEERYRIVADNTYAMEYWLGPDGRFVYVSPSCERITGYTAAEFAADPGLLQRLVLENDRAALQPHYNLAFIEKEPPEQLEFRLRRRDGTEAWVAHHCQSLFDAGGRFLGRRASLRDITGRKLAEARTREERDFSEALLDSVPGVIYLFDAQGRFLRWNRNFERVTGYSAGEIARMHPRDFFDGADQRLIEERIQAVFVRGESTAEAEFIAKDGTRRPYFFTGLRVTLRGTLCLVGVGLDITERKQAEEEIRRSLAAKDVLLKEVHHRVKNNLQVICSLLNLQSCDLPDARTRSLFEDCQNRVQSMALVHEKLYRTPDLATIDFGEHVCDLARILMRSYASPSGHVRLELDTERVIVDMDTAIPMSLILNELAANAHEHAFAHGRTGTLKISLHPADDGHACLSVSDDGPGLPPDFAWEQCGSLGLKMVRILTRQIRGEISLPAQAGTTVTVRFPAMQRSAAGPPPERSAAGLRRLGPTRPRPEETRTAGDDSLRCGRKESPPHGKA